MSVLNKNYLKNIEKRVTASNYKIINYKNPKSTRTINYIKNTICNPGPMNILSFLGYGLLFPN